MRIKALLLKSSLLFFITYLTHSLFAIPSFPTPLIIQKKVLILVHGTFAKDTQWYKPNGDFHQALKQSFPEYSLNIFTWSGGPLHEDRIKAGSEFLQFLKKYYVHVHDINIIAHSHGVNVVIIALQESIRLNLNMHISHFYTLAPPINTEIYNPPMNIIGKLHNLFSYGDCIQKVSNLFDRTFTLSKIIHNNAITNTQIKINNQCPSHSDLHHPLIAFLLPKLDILLSKNHDSMIHLFTNGLVHIEPDTERERDLLIDKKFTETVLTSFIYEGRKKF